MRRAEVGMDPEKVLETVALAFDMDKSELLAVRRRTPARLLAMRLLVDLTGWTGRQVAKRFGLSDGSAISHYLKSWQQQRGKTQQLKALEDEIIRQLNGF